MRPIPTLLISSLAATASAMSTGGSADTIHSASLTDQPAQDTTDATVIKTYFKEGLRFETADKNFTYKMGAKILYDNVWTRTSSDFEDDFSPSEQDAAKFRQARISGEGLINQKFEFKWQYDFSPSAGNEVKFKDLYVGIRDLCFGNLRVGQFKEPMGLEELTSFGSNTFLERGAPDRLLPARNIGIMAYDHCRETKRLNWAFGIFRDDTRNDTGANQGDGAYAATARISGAPIMRADDDLVHVGASFSQRALRDTAFLIDYKGESALTQTTIASAGDTADHQQILGLEAAWQRGPLSVQSEYVVTAVDRTNDTHIDLNGFYIFASYFLTGEHRPYKSETGTFSRVKVSRPLWGKEGGCGGWEAALRYSHLDLNNEDSPQAGNIGGDVHALTAGLNWYWNDYMKMMFNLTHEEMDGDSVSAGTPAADIFAIRLQLDV